MIIDRLPKSEIDDYTDLIRAVCSMSNLFSESDKPYIDYRIAENLFCRCFRAENLSRSDCSVDARIGRIGVGIKTFLDNTNSQKIAEFNRDSFKYRDLDDEDAARIISMLRNERLEFTKRTYGVDETIYHCLVRGSGLVNIIENPMDLISTEKISDFYGKNNVIYFTDGKCQYSFNKSKSTLYKKFDCESPLLKIKTEIFSDPFEMIRGLPKKEFEFTTLKRERESVILPLYSLRKKGRYVPEKSGLNQWNASGRRRSCDEVYIPVPQRIHKSHPNFFPPRYTEFILRLPDGTSVLSAKICQENGKALMTNPNSALGDWILRKVLGVPEGMLVTYDLLENLGINATVVYKNSNLDYSIDFTYVDIYSDHADISIPLRAGNIEI